MFSRNPDKEPAPATQAPALPTHRPMPQSSPPLAATVSGKPATTSIIGSDLAIIGSGLKNCCPTDATGERRSARRRRRIADYH